MIVCPICRHASPTIGEVLEHVDGEHPALSFRDIAEWLDSIGALEPAVSDGEAGR